jgi:muconolactone delta-isomerase
MDISSGSRKRSVPSDQPKVVGLYRAKSERELDGLLRALPLYEWMQVAVTPLEPHPNDPASALSEGNEP